jgi:CHAD domain-containing protein
MIPSGKWIEGIGPDTEVAEAARVSLDARLAAVVYWLPAAAYCAELDIEHVHRLRVSTRRAMAALKLYADWLPAKRLRQIKKQLKKIRRAAGDARDLDVLAERMRRESEVGDESLLAEIAVRRAKVQPAIEEIADHCRRKNSLARTIRKLLQGVRPRGPDCDHGRSAPFQVWAHERLAELAQAFFAAMPADDADTAALHQFRIQAKALRYAVELLAAGFGPELRDEHYPVIEKLQERLGRINDHAAAAAHFREWSSDDPSRASAFEGLAQQEMQRLDEEERTFREWWSPERVEALRRGLLGESRQGRRTILA